MLRIVLREIAVLLLSLTVFPAVLILALVYTDSTQAERLYLYREFAGAAGLLSEPAFTYWFKFVAPYLVVQAIRAYRWSHRSAVGKKWANLYFFALPAMIGARSLYLAWDLWYFMYALGDMPEELLQFLELEGVNLGLAFVSFVLAARSFTAFLETRTDGVADEKHPE